MHERGGAEGSALRWPEGAPRAGSVAQSEELRRTVAQLVLETTAEAIWLIDAQSHTTFVNRHMAELLGYAEEEMLGKSLFDFLDPASWSMAERSLQRRRQGFEDRREVELLRKDGTKVWVLGWANPIFDANGEYAGALGVLGDLNVQKDRERELRAEIAELRRRLAARRGSPTAKPAAETPAYREPFRSAVVVATCSAFVATVALAGLSAVLGSLLGIEVPMSSDTIL